MARGASPHRGPCGRDRVCSSPARSRRDYDTMMSRPEFLRYNEREAARLRDTLAATTTPALKARLRETIETTNASRRAKPKHGNWRPSAPEAQTVMVNDHDQTV